MVTGLLVFVIFNLFFLFLLFFLMLSFVTGAPFVPTPKRICLKMIEYANLKKGSKVCDLGSGDGRLLFLAAGQEATAYGYEINPYLVFWTHFMNLFNPRRKQIHAAWKSFWSVNLSQFDVIFVYLIPWHMHHLEQKILKEAKPGAVVISHSFIFPKLTQTLADHENHIFVFKKAR